MQMLVERIMCGIHSIARIVFVKKKNVSESFGYARGNVNVGYDVGIDVYGKTRKDRIKNEWVPKERGFITILSNHYKINSLRCSSKKNESCKTNI